MQKPWRSRFTNRLASRVSHAGVEDPVPRQRLFPYGIADARREPPIVPKTKPKVVPGGVKKTIVKPERKVETVPGWQFRKR